MLGDTDLPLKSRGLNPGKTVSDEDFFSRDPGRVFTFGLPGRGLISLAGQAPDENFLMYSNLKESDMPEVC